MNVQVVRDVYAAFGRGDLPAVIAACAADIDWRAYAPSVTPYSGRFTGHAGVQRFFESFLGAVRLSKFEPRTFLATGDTVVVLGGEAGTILSTGRETSYDWAQVFVVRGVKIAEFREFTDAATD